MGGKSGQRTSNKEKEERRIRKAERKAKKAAHRAIAREAKANGEYKEPEGWAKGIQKGKYGEDIFDGKAQTKWPVLFKKHLEYLESHIEILDRVMQGMQSEMKGMGEEQRRQFELGGDSKYRTLCGLMDRARETLVAARFASHVIIPPSWQQDKNGLGVKGFQFEPLLPKLQMRAEAEGFSWGEPKLDSLWGLPAKQSASKSDSSEASSAEEGSDESGGSSEDSDASSSEDEAERTETRETESSKPAFFVDTNPTPVDVNDSRLKKSKKRSSEEPDEPSSAKKSKLARPELTQVDFTAVEAQLRAEVEAGLMAKEKEEEEQARKREKKRKRSSDGIQGTIESFKKKQKLELREKAKALEPAASADSSAREGKKGKKRKAERGDDDANSKKARGDE